jgi:hypothetical protein
MRHGQLLPHIAQPLTGSKADLAAATIIFGGDSALGIFKTLESGFGGKEVVNAEGRKAMLMGARPFSGPSLPFCLPVIAARSIVLSIGAESSG